jgi:hypothetical protein
VSPSDFSLFLIHPPELSSNYQQRHHAAKQEKLGKEIAIEIYRTSISFILAAFFNMLQKHDMRLPALLSLQRKSCYGFLSLLKK